MQMRKLVKSKADFYSAEPNFTQNIKTAHKYFDIMVLRYREGVVRNNA